MPSIYQKKNPAYEPVKGGESRARAHWFAKVKVHGRWTSVALKLEAPSGKRLAEKRAADLQRDIDSGVIGDAVAAWLGEKMTDRIGAALACPDDPEPGSPTGWASACEAYLRSCRAKDTKTRIPNTARTVNRTLVFRRLAIESIARWFAEQGIPFGQASFTSAMIRRVEARKAAGIQPNTLWGSDYGMGLPWGEWLHARGLVEKPNREKIREVMPRKVAKAVTLPDAGEDTGSIRFFRDHRHDVVYKEEVFASDAKGSGHVGVNRRKSARYMAAWALILCTRGLGCRPTEATSLTWKTVDLAGGTVIVLDTKTGLARKIPILFRWVQEGLEELAARPRTSEAVCCSTMRKPWSHDSGIYYCIREICQGHDIPVYHLKRAQKLYIAQLIASGFPPNVVAKWTGHSLTVQERHYCEDQSYLPSDHRQDYGEFGLLTPWGERVKSHLSSFARDAL